MWPILCVMGLFLTVFFFIYSLLHFYLFMRAKTALGFGPAVAVPLALFLVVMITAPHSDTPFGKCRIRTPRPRHGLCGVYLDGLALSSLLHLTGDRPLPPLRISGRCGCGKNGSRGSRFPQDHVSCSPSQVLLLSASMAGLRPGRYGSRPLKLPRQRSPSMPAP